MEANRATEAIAAQREAVKARPDDRELREQLFGASRGQHLRSVLGGFHDEGAAASVVSLFANLDSALAMTSDGGVLEGRGDRENMPHAEAPSK